MRPRVRKKHHPAAVGTRAADGDGAFGSFGGGRRSSRSGRTLTAGQSEHAADGDRPEDEQARSWLVEPVASRASAFHRLVRGGLAQQRRVLIDAPARVRGVHRVRRRARGAIPLRRPNALRDRECARAAVRRSRDFGVTPRIDAKRSFSRCSRIDGLILESISSIQTNIADSWTRRE